MTTSGVNTFSVNRDEIIRFAMLTIGKLEESEVPTAQEVSDCAAFLNMLVKQWQGKADFAPGLKTWTRRHGYLFLQSNTGKYIVGPGAIGWTLTPIITTTSAAALAGQPIVMVTNAAGIVSGDNFGVQTGNNLNWYIVLSVVGTTVTLTTNLTGNVSSGAQVFDYTVTATQPLVIESVFLRDNTNSDVPVRLMTNIQYNLLPSKTDPTNIGDPLAIYYEFQLGNSYLYTDVAGAQDVTKYLCIDYLDTEEDFVSPTDTPAYPQEWYLPLSLGLSRLIAPVFHAEWTPLMEANYQSALKIAQEKEPEIVTMYFEPGRDE